MINKVQFPVIIDLFFAGEKPSSFNNGVIRFKRLKFRLNDHDTQSRINESLLHMANRLHYTQTLLFTVDCFTTLQFKDSCIGIQAHIQITYKALRTLLIFMYGISDNLHPHDLLLKNFIIFRKNLSFTMTHITSSTYQQYNSKYFVNQIKRIITNLRICSVN